MLCPTCGCEIPVTPNGSPAPGTSSGPGTTTATAAVLSPLDDSSPATVAFDGGLTFIAPLSSPGTEISDAQTLAPPVTGAGLAGETTPLPVATDGSKAPPRSVPRMASDVGPLQPGQSFGPRYRIIRLLGIGGMGAVYQAWDAELGVAVAIKIIRPEVMANPKAANEIERRFKRELLLARKVTHKNVVRIHDLGEIDGIKYITMPYVDGSDLSTVLKREGKLPVTRALRVARGIVSGLAEAHAADVVHRDLKPANIMVAVDDEPMIMDFGIARSTGGTTPDPAPEMEGAPPDLLSGPAPAAAHTMVGAVVGTIEYMAPEQAKGQPVDQRADVYALGLILYDTFAGRHRAEHAESAIAELRGRMVQAPPALKTIDAAIPDAIDRLVARCLEPDPAKRFQSTVELAAELRRLDDKGEPIPIRRVVGLPLVVAVVCLLLAGSVGVWWYARQGVPAAPHAPVSVLIADLRNTTPDPGFTHVLEPMLKRALEGAGFISAYDRNGIARTIGVRPPEDLDDTAARELAVKQGLGVVLTGSIAPDGRGYEISLKAAQAVTGHVIADTSAGASSKEQVLPAATKLVARVRKALGDSTSDSAQMFAMSSVSATSLDVVREYAAAMEAASNNGFEEARQHMLKAVALDPKFGIGYQVLAVASRNLGQVEDSITYIQLALRHLDQMTERERFSTRGMFYRLTGDYPQCVKEYTDLIGRYAGDVVARNQLALCASKLRDLRRAQDEMRQVVKILPKRVLFRDNLALYANYAGDFQTAEQEARTVEAQEPDRYGRLALAFAQIGQGQAPQAIETYGLLATMGDQGASWAASGLGDTAAYQGRYAEAAKIIEKGAAADLALKNGERAAAKFVALAHVHLLRGQKGPAVADAQKALANSTEVKIRFLAARALIEAGDVAKARPLVAGLASEIQAEPQACAKILEGILALKNKDLRGAIKSLTEANGLLDTWIGHFELGRAYLEAGQFPQADSEFDRCLKRRGEALSLFLDEEPTYAYFPVVYYYQGRVREGLRNAGFADAYRAYLNIRGQSREDPLLPEIRRRAGAR